MMRLTSVLAVMSLFGLLMIGCQSDQVDNLQPTDPSATESEFPNDIGLLEKSGGPQRCGGKIGNFIWFDEDCDGMQDCHNTANPEEGIEGVTVTLKDPVTGEILATTTTDSLGRYTFRHLCAGSYLVEVTPPDGYVPTMVGAADSLKDSNPNPYLVVLGDNQINKSIDFGFCEGMGGEGCTPGYWKQDQHFDSWPAPYTPDMLFSDVFEDAFPGMTLVEVASTGGGGLEALGRHAVSALLNAASSGVDYDLTTQEVLDMFNNVYPGSDDDYETLKDVFANYNEQDCPLN